MAAVTECDYLVIGGGLAGVLASYRLAKQSHRVVLVDKSLPAASGQLGGFLKFSGAKFSLLPAGQGLTLLAGGTEQLRQAHDFVLSLLGINSSAPSSSVDSSLPNQPGSLELRGYDSIVLSPKGIDEIVSRIPGLLEGVRLVDDTVAHLRRDAGTWKAHNELGTELARSPVAIYAGGRTGGELLARAGAVAQEGKGLDVGVRVEFLHREALQGLRELGPDAKILSGPCRTFCLNSPGVVYRYSYNGIEIPGGVVAGPDTSSANVGILHRVPLKKKFLPMMIDRISKMGPGAYASTVVERESVVEKFGLMVEAYGKDPATTITAFAEDLGHAGLADWSSPHRVHFPLLDWHWSTYALPGSHRTTMEGLFVVGDSAGHARGLLQAATSGWLAAAEAEQL